MTSLFCFKFYLKWFLKEWKIWLSSLCQLSLNWLVLAGADIQVSDAPSDWSVRCNEELWLVHFQARNLYLWSPVPPSADGSSVPSISASDIFCPNYFHFLKVRGEFGHLESEDRNNNTPLHLAAKQGHEGVVQVSSNTFCHKMSPMCPVGWVIIWKFFAHLTGDVF